MSEEERKLLEENIVYEDTIIEQNKEIEKLNNIVEELKERSLEYSAEIDRYILILDKLEDWVLEQYDLYFKYHFYNDYRKYKEVLDKIKELRGDGK